MPETFNSGQTRPMNEILVGKLRENASELRSMHENGASARDLLAAKSEMLNVIFRILSIHLGTPPSNFLWEWRDKDKTFHREEMDGGFITPLEFFERYVDYPLQDMVCLINAPTNDKPFGKMYTIQYLGNVVGGQEIRYCNVDITVLKQAAIEMIRNQQAVWFGCDVGKKSQRDLGIMDSEIYDLELVLDTAFRLNKAERLDYGDSRMTHAMLFTGVDLDASGNAMKWRVENSWGTELGDKGYMLMSDRWFDEYLYEVMVDKRYLPQDLLAVLDTPAKVLPPWDPMGALAKAS